MLKDGLNSCCPPPCHSWLKLPAVNSISHDLFSRFKIHSDICYPSSVCLFYIFSVGASSWDAEKTRFPASKLWLCTCASCPRSSTSLVLCALLTNPNTRNCFLSSKADPKNAPNSSSSMLNIFPCCLTNLEHSSAVIVLCHVNADSSGNVGTFLYVL